MKAQPLNDDYIKIILKNREDKSIIKCRIEISKNYAEILNVTFTIFRQGRKIRKLIKVNLILKEIKKSN